MAETLALAAAQEEGRVVRDGVGVAWNARGTGEPAILLLPTWSILHSRVWKHQAAHLARHFRVVTFDGRGNGASDRPRGPEHYTDECFVDDALAVLDAAGVERAVVVGLSKGCHWAVLLAARHPARVRGAVLFAPAAPVGDELRRSRPYPFHEELDTTEGWAKFNASYWRRDYPGFVRFFMAESFPEPHSSKALEDAVSWALETTPEVLVDTVRGGVLPGDGGGEGDPEALYRAVRAPVLVVHGEEDRVVPPALGARVARLTGGRLVKVPGAGHGIPGREPVAASRLIEGFARRVAGGEARGERTRTRSRSRRAPRALFLSSPIGLGHARRDLAVAAELRHRVPGVAIDWLAQHPVTVVLEAAGERVHPASRHLASESRHLESWAGEHRLHAFQAYRAMDEVLTANFMVFQEVVETGAYDVVVGDEAWEVDHYWHEHPELKRGRFAWMTDFVGFLPMPEGGAPEEALVADYNAEMIGHVERRPGVRDLALFFGEPEDVVAARFGPGLPEIREWTAAHFELVGAVPGFDPATVADRARLRSELGWRPGERVCVVAVGGSGVGEPLLRRVLAGLPAIRRRVPGLRVVAVAGPRIDPACLGASLPAAGAPGPGLEVHAYVHGLYRLLAACDVAIVQGGLGTTLELAAAGTPFLFVPVRSHFEQAFHVRHRLERLGVGRAVDYGAATPEALAVAVAEALEGDAAPPAFPGAGGAARAAERIATLF